MIKLSIPRSSNKHCATRPARRFGFCSAALPKIRVVQACVLVILFVAIFNQPVLSKPAVVWRPQTSNTVEGFKLIQEGQRLVGIGTRAALMDAIDKFKAAYEWFRKDNLRAGMGLAQFTIGASYST